jgi:hypothetical protein
MQEPMTTDRSPTREDGASERVGARQFWAWSAPWVGYALLALAGVLGLFTASDAEDPASYFAGMLTFVLAVAIIAFLLKRQFDGPGESIWWAVTPTSADALWFHIPILAVLGLVGLVLGASEGGIFAYAGLAFFVACALLIFLSIKHYFDLREG